MCERHVGVAFHLIAGQDTGREGRGERRSRHARRGDVHGLDALRSGGEDQDQIWRCAGQGHSGYSGSESEMPGGDRERARRHGGETKAPAGIRRRRTPQLGDGHRSTRDARTGVIGHSATDAVSGRRRRGLRRQWQRQHGEQAYDGGQER
jgi:hypothetical protein